MEPPAYQVESNSILYSADAEDPPRWFLAAAVFSGAGLLLGMLMVMIGSLS